MARKKKEIFDNKGNDIRNLGYYSTPLEVSHYIQKSILEINPRIKSVLDPAVGNEELLDLFIDKKISIDSFDVARLKTKYKSRFNHSDFLDYVMKNFPKTSLKRKKLRHDAIIMNPPYNCHEVDYIQKNRKKLKEYFVSSKALNMYSLFMDAVISNSKPGAIIGMIVPDSFMTNIMHKDIRGLIISGCIIHKVLLCPINLFWSQKADVRTCILVLEKNKPNSSPKTVRYMQRSDDIDTFFNLLKKDRLDTCKSNDIYLSNSEDNKEIVLGAPKSVLKLFNNIRIGNAFKCVTGISTGNDGKYLSPIQTEEYPYQFFKNPGSHKFTCEPQGYLVKNFLEISNNEKTFMVRNKKFIGKEGITCSSMGVKFSACFLPEKSTFGVNANIFPPKQEIGWLCCYLNSSLVQYILRAILVRSNMVTSGYVSRIPLVNFSQIQKKELNKIYISAVQKEQNTKESIIKIDNIINKCCDFEKFTINKINNFCSNLYRNT